MTDARIISEIAPLMPEELSTLAERLAQTDDSREALRLRETLVRGSFGMPPTESASVA